MEFCNSQDFNHPKHAEPPITTDIFLNNCICLCIANKSINQVCMCKDMFMWGAKQSRCAMAVLHSITETDTTETDTSTNRQKHINSWQDNKHTNKWDINRQYGETDNTHPLLIVVVSCLNVKLALPLLKVRSSTLEIQCVEVYSRIYMLWVPHIHLTAIHRQKLLSPCW